MKNKYIIGALFSFAILGTSFGQDTENLVKNGSFEETKGKLKRLKQIDKAEDWFSPTTLKADLYSSRAPSGSGIEVPQNAYGKEDAADGENYAGITAYSYRGKSPRTYLSKELDMKLERGVRYCISYDLSLADLSKYAVNNVGAVLSKKAFEIDGKKDIVLGKKDEEIVKVGDNKLFEKRYSWEKMCAEYEGVGGEKFITIGNFDETKDTKFLKLRKKKDYKGTQVPMAYYYIDNVKVVIIEEGESCNCDDVEEAEVPRIIYSKANTSLDGFTPEEKVANSTVYFAYLKANLLPNTKDDLDVLAEVLIENPKMKLTVKGHSTKDEAMKAKSKEEFIDLAERRVDNVIEYLKSHGLSEDRFEKEILDNTEPADAEGTDVAKAKNRRVEFVMQ
ncbi:MAG: OmpA family protein [Flavobacteriales bacterium]